MRPVHGSVTRFIRWVSVAAGIAAAAACAVGPDYHRPKLDAAPDYKEAGDWKPSEPNDVLSRGPWWEIFHDDDLNQLEVRVDISNENVKAAAAAFDQARALVAQARAGFWPTIGVSAARAPAHPRELPTAPEFPPIGIWISGVRFAARPRVTGRRHRPAPRPSPRLGYPPRLNSQPIILNCERRTNCR